MKTYLIAAAGAAALLCMTAGANAAPAGADLKSAIQRDATQAQQTHWTGWRHCHKRCVWRHGHRHCWRVCHGGRGHHHHHH